MAHIVVIGKEQEREYELVEGELQLAEFAMYRRAYASLCYAEALQISRHDGPRPLREPYHHLIGSYRADSGVMGTVAFSGSQGE